MRTDDPAGACARLVRAGVECTDDPTGWLVARRETNRRRQARGRGVAGGPAREQHRRRHRARRRRPQHGRTQPHRRGPRGGERSSSLAVDPAFGTDDEHDVAGRGHGQRREGARAASCSTTPSAGGAQQPGDLVGAGQRRDLGPPRAPRLLRRLARRGAPASPAPAPHAPASTASRSAPPPTGRRRRPRPRSGSPRRARRGPPSAAPARPRHAARLRAARATSTVPTVAATVACDLAHAALASAQHRRSGATGSPTRSRRTVAACRPSGPSTSTVAEAASGPRGDHEDAARSPAVERVAHPREQAVLPGC
jgi:hypothetical protein